MKKGLTQILQLPEGKSVKATKQATQFGQEFRRRMGELNQKARVLAASGNRSDYQTIDGQKGKLYAAYQQASAKFDGANSEKAEAGAMRVLAAVGSVDAKVSKQATSTQAAQSKWLEQEDDFDDALRQIGDLEQAGHPNAVTYRKVGDAIRKQAHDGKFQEASVAFSQLKSKLDKTSAEHQDRAHSISNGTPSKGSFSDPDAARFESKALKMGAAGPAVGHLQTSLNTAGVDVGVDEDFGRKTKEAVNRFQKSQGLKVDGVVGPKTWGKLNQSKDGPKVGSELLKQQIRVDHEMLEQGIRDARIENLMILYVDSFRSDDRQTDFYERRVDVPGRLAFSKDYISRRSVRRLILQEFEGGVTWVTRQTPPRPETLFWFHTSFPAKYLQGAPSQSLTSLQGIIERLCKRVSIGSQTLWDLVLQVPAQQQQRREEEAAVDQQRREHARGAINAINSALEQVAMSERFMYLCYSSIPGRGIGGNTGFREDSHRNFADGMRRFVITVNQIRSGRRPSVSGLRPGAPRTVMATMVTEGSNTWGSLDDHQQAALRDNDMWDFARDAIWLKAKELINAAILEIEGRLVVDANSLCNGSFRNPPGNNES